MRISSTLMKNWSCFIEVLGFKEKSIETWVLPLKWNLSDLLNVIKGGLAGFKWEVWRKV